LWGLWAQNNLSKLIIRREHQPIRAVLPAVSDFRQGQPRELNRQQKNRLPATLCRNVQTSVGQERDILGLRQA
jgi:hypothetical protein